MSNITVAGHGLSHQELTGEVTQILGFTVLKIRVEACSMLAGEIVEESSDMVRQIRFAFRRHFVLEINIDALRR